MTATTLTEILDRVCDRRADHVAIRESAAAWSFGELRDWSQTLSRMLEREVHEAGIPVVLLLPNSGAFASAFLAVARLGGVVAPLNYLYRSQELRYYLEDLEPAAVITIPDLVPRLLDVFPALNRPPSIFAIESTRMSRVHRGEPAGSPLSGTVSPLFLQYTSGSTGRPKKVARSHAALVAELAALQSVFGTGPSDRFLGVTPFSHVNGLVRTMLSALYAGATLYPVDGFRRREILSLVSRERLTFWGGVPQMFAILGQTPPRGETDLSSLRLVFSSSAPLLAGDHRRFQELYGQTIRQLYGSTETGTICFNTDDDPSRSLDSVGAPLPGVAVDVVDASGQRVTDGVEGELVIRSPFAASEYLGNPLATETSFGPDGYRTGDLGCQDPRGFVFITGRTKLLLNRGGLKVNPYEVEEAIAQHPGVREVVVFGSPGPHGDDLIRCFIVPAGHLAVDDVVRHCRERIADYKIPSSFEFRGSLPRASTGKVLRAQL